MKRDSILALAELFAIVANKNLKIDNKLYLDVFTNFLTSVVEESYVKDILKFFSDNLAESATGDNLKKLSLNSVKLIAKLEKLKSSLSSCERYFVFLHLIILNNKTGYTEYSEAFLDEVAHSFEIEQDLKTKIRTFIENNEENRELADSILFVHDELILFLPSIDTYLHNGKKLAKNEVCVLDKDSIVTDFEGKNYFFSEFRALCGNSEENEKFSLVVKNLEYKIKNKTLVQKTSVKFDSSQLIGIVGNSGSGKTSFLKCLAGFETKYSGEVGFVSDVYKNFNLAFVQQENSFVPKLSVEEHLYERAKFLQYDKQKSHEKINEILEFVNISEQRDNLVCKTDFSLDQISGGQQKRLAIATELLVNPSVLLLDEPTSGLSSEDAYDIMAKLKQLTKQGKLVIASIHQPELDLFLMFDKILVFDDGGYTVYFGKPQDAVEYVRKIDERIDRKTVFTLSKRPSILLNLLKENKAKNNKESLKHKLYSIFINENKSLEDLDLKTNVQTNRLNGLRSFLYYLRFGFFVDFKHKLRLLLMLVLPLIAGVLLSLVTRYSYGETYQYFYNPNIPVWLLIVLTIAVFVGLVSSGHEFIYLRKYINNKYKISPNYLPHVLAVSLRYVIYSFIQTLALVLPSVFIVGAGFHFADMFLFSFLMCVWGSLFGLLLSYLLKTNLMVYLLIPLIIIPQLVYSGALIRFSEFNKNKNSEREIPVVASFIPMRWAAEGVIYNLYAENPYYSKLYENRCELYEASYFADIYVPELMELKKTDSLQVYEILKNEQIEFIENFVNIDNSLSNIEQYYKVIKQNCLQKEDSIITAMPNGSEAKLKYSNQAISNIVNYVNKGNFIAIKNAKTCRNFKNIYSNNNLQIENEKYMVGSKSLCNITLKTGQFNLLVLMVLDVFLFFLLVVVATLKRSR